jgi:peptide/nickel transport system permease protein
VISYIVRRTLQLLPVLLLGSIGIFLMVYLTPGGPVGALLGEDPTQEQIDALTERLGLNDPILVQYGRWAGNALQGDLGTSFRINQPVTELIAERLPATFQLAFVAMFIALVVALPLALLSVRWPGGPVDRFVTGFAALVLAVPTFWLGILLILYFSVNLGMFPSAATHVSLFVDPMEALRNVFLPALVLGLSASGILVRFLRASLLGEMSADYVRTARSKGVRQRTVLTNHVLKNAMLPFITVVGLQIGALVTGAVVTESVFTYPGLGRLLVQAISQRDYPVIQGTILIILVFYVIVNVLVDVAYAYLDPRIEYSA